MKVILGPCRCQGCSALVIYAGHCHPRCLVCAKWRNADGKLHRCKP